MNSPWRQFLSVALAATPVVASGQTEGGSHLEYTNTLNCEGQMLICVQNPQYGHTYDLIPVMKDGTESNRFSGYGHKIDDQNQQSACWGPFTIDDDTEYFTFSGTDANGAAIRYDDKVYVNDLHPQITVTPADLIAETDPCDATKTRIVLTVSDDGNIYYLTRQERIYDGSLNETNERVGTEKDGGAGRPLT